MSSTDADLTERDHSTYDRRSGEADALMSSARRVSRSVSFAVTLGATL